MSRILTPTSTDKAAAILDYSSISKASTILGEAHSPGDDVLVVEGKVVAKYIVAEMLRNTSSANENFTKIKLKWEIFRGIGNAERDAPAQRIIALFDAFFDFGVLVRYDGIWDHKTRIRNMFGKHSMFNGILLPFDVWSNMHYGYVGSAIGFPRDLLMRAAGAVSLSPSGTISRDWIARWLDKNESIMSSLDDARDQEAIKIGLNAFSEYGPRLMDDNLLSVMKPRLGLLVNS